MHTVIQLYCPHTTSSCSRGTLCFKPTPLQRWAFPFVPDTNVLQRGGAWGMPTYRYNRGHVYCESQVQVARSATLHTDVCVGAGTNIGEGLGWGLTVGRGHVYCERWLVVPLSTQMCVHWRGDKHW